MNLPGISSLSTRNAAAVGTLVAEVIYILGGLGVLHVLGYRFSEASPLRSRRFWLVVALGCLAIVLSDEIIRRIGDLLLGAAAAAEGSDAHADLLQRVPLWSTFLSLTVLGPIFEEITFRGLLLKYVFTRHVIIGAVISTALFALVHVPETGVDWLQYLIPGAVLATAYCTTRRLEASILIHALTNLYVYVGAIATS